MPVDNNAGFTPRPGVGTQTLQRQAAAAVPAVVEMPAVVETVEEIATEPSSRSVFDTGSGHWQVMLCFCVCGACLSRTTNWGCRYISSERPEAM